MSEVQLSNMIFQVCAHCNLKCKGCGAFSNYAEEEFADLAQYTRDIVRLSEIFLGGIKEIFLMGGEPFLNPQLGEFVKITRKIFMYSDIYIVTNGLLIPKISEEIFTIIKEYNAVLSISRYLPTFAIEDKIIERMDDLGIKYEFRGDIVRQFFKNKNIQGVEDKEKAFASCFRCYTLKEGILAQCGFPIHAKSNFKKYFNFDFMEFEPDKDYIAIHTTKLTAQQIIDLFEKSKDYCRFCRIHDPEMFDWAITEKDIPDIYDWSVR